MQKPSLKTNSPFDSPSPLQNLETGKFTSARVLTILIAYVIVRSVVGAAMRPFWYDEVCTWIVVRQGSLSGIWAALAHAADGQPPLFYLIERIFAALVRNEEVAYRLPSILGFCCTLICLFVFIRRRAGGVYALICTGIPLSTILFERYAIESRPYCMVVACVAVALIAYQRAPSLRWTIAMAVVLVASVSLNYYAVFAIVPFGLAELYVLLVRRQVRWSVWIAMAAGAVPLAVFWPLLANLKHYYGGHLEAQASISRVIHIYGTFFLTSPSWGVAVAAAAALALLGLLRYGAIHSESGAAQEISSAHEYFLALGLVALPVISYIVAKLTQTAITDRYDLSAILGISIAAGYILPHLDRRAVILATGALLALLAVQEGSFWMANRRPFAHNESPAESLEKLAAQAGHPDLPIVISDGLEYLSIAHYAAAPWSDRFVALVDVQASLNYTNDLVDRELLILRSFAPLHVYELADFASQRQVFLLYSSNGFGGDPHDWWTSQLVQHGYTLKVLTVDHRRIIYLVSRTQETR